MRKKREYNKDFWREIRKRDNAECQNPFCNDRIFSLRSRHFTEQHHIRDWSNNPKLRFKKDNVITLCKTKRTLFGYKKEGCHQRLHRLNGGTRRPTNQRSLDRLYLHDSLRLLFKAVIALAVVAVTVKFI